MGKSREGLTISAMGKLVLGLGVILLALSYFKYCEGLPSTMCVHVGSGRLGYGVWQIDPNTSSNYTTNYYTLGAETFSNEFQRGIAANWYGTSVEDGSLECYFEIVPIPNYRDLQVCVNDTQVHLRIYYVRQEGRILNGWLHFEVELTDPNDKMLWVHMQVIDENFNAIGEFVHEDYNVNLDQHCPTKSELAQPTFYQYLPCSATGFREPKNSQALYMVNPKYLVNKSNEAYTQKENFDKGFHVTWRFSENWCSRHYRFRPVLYILTENNKNIYLKHGKFNDDHRVYRKAGDYWLLHKFFGSWDGQAKSKGKLECDGGKDRKYLIMENHNFYNNSIDGWIYDAFKYTFGTDVYAKDQRIPDPSGGGNFVYKSCQVNPFASDFTASKEKVPKFGGRCKSLFDKTEQPDKGQYQDCNRNRSAPEFREMLGWRNYSEYVQNLTLDRFLNCNSTCNEPITLEDRTKIEKYPRGEITKSQAATNTSIFSLRPSTTLIKFMRGRKFHGIMCIIGAMFVTPISLFVARYYKETFMACECCGAKGWYWVHVGTSVANVALYFSSQTAIAPSIQTMGNNVDEGGSLHRMLGWVSHSLFIFLVLFGGCRMGPTQKTLRFISILIHAILGFTQYLLNAILIIQSAWVPASPTVSACDDDGFPMGFSSISTVVLAWLVIDILFHLALSALQCLADKRGVARAACCVLIPVMSGSSHDDLVGWPLRKILLPMYVLVCGAITTTSVMMVSLGELPNKCEFGNMSCTDALGCSSYAQAFRKRIDEAAAAAAP